MPRIFPRALSRGGVIAPVRESLAQPSFQIMQLDDIAIKIPFTAPAACFKPRILRKPSRRWSDNVASDLVIACAALGDWLVAFAALRLVCTLVPIGVIREIPLLHHGNGYAILGALTLLTIFSSGDIYGRRYLLHLHEILTCFFRGGFLWSLFFLAFIALIGGVSRSTAAFALTTIGLTAVSLLSWRMILHRVISSERVSSHLRQRILLIGWTPEAGRMAQSVWQSRTHPSEIVGYVEVPGSQASCAAPANIPFLGGIDDLPAILEDQQINTAWLSDINVDVNRIPQFAAQCEKEMVEFKIIPSYFPILLSAVHVESVCGTPILGVDLLPLNFFHLRLLKRLADIVVGLAGLILTAPIVACFCALVLLESPGPVFYRQMRMGRRGKPFQIIKIRSMRLDAEKNGKPGWTTRDDPRRLRIGSLMRKWNIDELPQFWNVLKGEMSLVGPRPERPELIQSFKHEIEHYNARHTIKPGVTGWAQVNGLRGDTDLSERIRHDIFYVEHWSLFFDLRIMIHTFFRHQNAC